MSERRRDQRVGWSAFVLEAGAPSRRALARWPRSGWLAAMAGACRLTDTASMPSTGGRRCRRCWRAAPSAARAAAVASAPLVVTRPRCAWKSPRHRGSGTRHRRQRRQGVGREGAAGLNRSPDLQKFICELVVRGPSREASSRKTLAQRHHAWKTAILSKASGARPTAKVKQYTRIAPALPQTKAHT